MDFKNGIYFTNDLFIEYFCECSFHVNDRVRLNLRFTFIISSKYNPHNSLTIVNAPMSP